MKRSNLFFKVELEHESDESPERTGEEICRRIAKFYGVVSAELTNVTSIEE